ncbi:MAG: alpha/beta fold hydrolase [Halothece sp.]
MVTAIQQNWNEGFIQTNNVQLHYVSEGEGPLMLMLHGFPEFWYSWRHQIPEFAKDYQVVAPDLRGYNDSDKPQGISAYAITELVEDVKGIIEGFGKEKCVLVGHDWGGAIAWHFAYTYPEMLEKLIIMNLPHPAEFSKGLKTPQQLLKSWYIFFFQLPFLPEWFLSWHDYSAIAAAFTEMAIDQTAFTQQDIEAFKEAAGKRGALTAMINYYRCAFRDLFQLTDREWGRLDIPTLMIWGEQDTALGKELTYGTEKYVKNLQLRYLPKCSHWVQQEQPELVNRYLREFLQDQ